MNDRVFAEVCRRQYVAALEMLRNAIERCPAALWDRREATEAPFWQHALHVLFYARLYLLPTIDGVEATENAAGVMRELGSPLKDWSDEEVARLARTMAGLCDAAFRPVATVPRQQMMERLAATEDACEQAFEQVGAGSGEARNPMPWLSGTRADLLLYNLRHIQHHVGRLHSILGRAGIRLEWVGGLSRTTPWAICDRMEP